MPHFVDLLFQGLSTTYQRENKFYHYDFLQLSMVYFPGLSCQYGCWNPMKWWHFCFDHFGGLCSHQLLSCGRLRFLHKHQWIHWPNLSCQFKYSVSASMGQSDTRWPMVFLCSSHTLNFRSAPFSNIFAWKFFIVRLRYDETLSLRLQTQRMSLMGQGRIYIKFTSMNRVFTMERLIFPSLFQFINIVSFCLS